MTTLTIELAEFDALRSAKITAETALAAFKLEMKHSRLESLDTFTSALIACFRGGVEVARYAVGHLDGSFARKWPVKHLRAVADGLDMLPDANEHDHELATELRSFALDAARHDAGRVERYQPPPADSHGVIHAESADVPAHAKTPLATVTGIPGI